MKVLTIIAISLFCLILAVPVIAQTNAAVTINLDDLSPQEVARLMALKDLSKNGPPPSQSATQAAEEWVGFAEKFGVAIAGCAKELGIAANEFVQTPVGSLAAVLIVWKVIGQDWWAIIGGCLSWIVIVNILWRSFSHFHMCKKVVLREGGWRSKVLEVKFVRRYEFNTGDYETGSATAHGIAFALITIACLMIIF